MDRTRAMAEACVMTVNDFMKERDIEIPDRDDLTSDIEHVISMYQRFEEEDRTGGPAPGKIIAERVPVYERIDEWDPWSADTFPGWFIDGNGCLMSHGTTDPAWTGAMEIVDAFDEFEALEIIADGYLDREDREEMQKILRTAYAAQATDGNSFSNLDRSTNAGEIAYNMLARFRWAIVTKEDMIAYCLGITNGQKYKHCEIHGSVQREWNDCYYPAHQESDLTTCESMYFNLDEQFYVYDGTNPAPTVITAYGARSEDEYRECIADFAGCRPEDIDLYM